MRVLVGGGSGDGSFHLSAKGVGFVAEHSWVNGDLKRVPMNSRQQQMGIRR